MQVTREDSMTILDSLDTNVGSGMSEAEEQAVLDEVTRLAARLDRARKRLTNLADTLRAAGSNETDRGARPNAA